MKIVLGVCGFGNGHSMRQRPILEGLLARGHQVILIANDQSDDFFRQHYPQVQRARVVVPVMHTRPDGLDFAATANDPHNLQPQIGQSFWNACVLVEQMFGKPDIVVSDYEMVSAQIAYLFGVPLVTLDQQSKFLGYDVPSLGNYTPDEHRMRLGYFFPKARARFATSFFKITAAPVSDYPVTLIPPIIGQDIQQHPRAPRDKHITVYLSRASRIAQSFSELAAVFARFPEYTFLCVEGEGDLPPNVQVVPATRQSFLSCLCQSSAVISTAGHNLISEALYLRLPLFLLPFAHYEQQLNAHIVAQAGMGCAAPRLTEAYLSQFFSQLKRYRQRESDLIYRQFDGERVFLDALESLLHP